MTAATAAMRIESGLAAHFNEPDGPSRPGVSWLVELQHGGRTHHVRVKALLMDDATAATRKDQNYQAQTAMQYLAEELDKGWNPDDEREHTIYIGNPRVPLADPKPWWRFW